ncbi:MAG: FAD binding domain-containing protein [Burkholderiales bacterium]|nr:FAD binding domain-containing protein [Flavobacterium sp.]
MIEFLLNNRLIQSDKAPSTTLLDFIRYDQNLRGTKIGCREGDCGACTILIGALKHGKLEYSSATSCLTPLPNVNGKHVVTIEGLNLPDQLNQVQQAMVAFSGTQCGFCTPGFVNSLCGYALTTSNSNLEGAISAIDGNICRCTGYKSIERAAEKLSQQLLHKDPNKPLSWLVEHDFIPSYFLEVEEKLKAIPPSNNTKGKIPIGGGTDLYVQKHDEMHVMDLNYLLGKATADAITFDGNTCKIEAAVTATDLISNAILLKALPRWYDYLKLISSTPIRNIGTIAGNLSNGSPIGDFTIILLALNAEITLTDGDNQNRQLPLKDFYLAYKTLNKTANELISAIMFEVPSTTKFNFEKVCKRQYLDIASVNTAIHITTKDDKVIEVHCAMGGVGPIPKFLTQTCAFLHNKSIHPENIKQAEQVMQTEIAPISDARGTIAYKRLLARQLFFAHFITLFPDTIKMHDLI